MASPFPHDCDPAVIAATRYQELSVIGGVIRHAPFYDHDGVIRVGLWSGQNTQQTLFRLAATQIGLGVELTLQPFNGRQTGTPVFEGDDDLDLSGTVLEGGAHDLLVVTVDLESHDMQLYGDTDGERTLLPTSHPDTISTLAQRIRVGINKSYTALREGDPTDLERLGIINVDLV